MVVVVDPTTRHRGRVAREEGLTASVIGKIRSGSDRCDDVSDARARVHEHLLDHSCAAGLTLKSGHVVVFIDSKRTMFAETMWTWRRCS